MVILSREEQKRKTCIKLFGFKIFEKILDKEENFITTKYLHNLFVKKYDIYRKISNRNV